MRPNVDSAGGVTGGSPVDEYRMLLERVPVIVYIADAGDTGLWRYVSPQIETILGFTAEEWCADPELWAKQLHPADCDRVLAGEADDRSSSKATGAVEYRMLHRDGHVVWICDDAWAVRDELGEMRWHGLLSDVTDRKRTEAELRQRAAQQAAVARLGKHALERVAISDLMEEAVAAAADILGVEVAAVAEQTPERATFELRAAVGFPQAAIGRTLWRAGTCSQAGHTLLSGGPVVVQDWAAEQRFEQSPALRALGTRSGLTVAIVGRERPFGILGVQSTQPREYASEDVDFVQSLANVLADALERQTTEDDIRHRALHDPLTALPNRVLFTDRLEQTLARLRRQPRSPAAILFIDVDHFKLVNDSLGHHVGDQLLVAVAARLAQALRPSDTVARFGGDEFGILVDEIPDERDACAIAERIAAIFARPFILSGSEHFVTTSIGIMLVAGGERAADLIRDAEAAMCRAKERGRARYELFDEVIRGRAIKRLQIDNDLRRAIERDELRLEYQPIVCMRTEQIVGVEALLRWDHPERGPIPPDEFIPVAEENGLIDRIGQWVLEVACRQAVAWHDEHPDAAPIGLSVNLSGVQVARRGFPDAVAATLRETGLDPSCLSLEITESVLLDEGETVTQTLHALRSLGLRLVLDDFGTGYSSLGYLNRLPLDALKVDRSFVDGLGEESCDSAITEAIIAMARALSLEVIAEGTETVAQVALLRRMGCEFAQGYHFSRPVSAARITVMLNGGAPWLSQGLVAA